MQLSALASSLPIPLAAAVSTIAQLGFDRIDLPPTSDPETLRLLDEHQLKVACVALERDAPAGIDLASGEHEIHASSIAYYRQAITQTADLSAERAYFTPPTATDAATLDRWTAGLLAVADAAAERGVRLCIEHFPGRALATVAETLQFLDRLRHPALALLIDVGHCLISGEEPAAAVHLAGDRLGYVHFDDNDGEGDLHWPLLAGQLTRRQIVDTLSALAAIDYQSSASLELNATLVDPLANLRTSRALLLECGSVATDHS